MKILGDIMFPGGKFTDRGGNEKTRWIKCGALFQKANGAYTIKLDAVPLGMDPDGGWFSVFEKKPQPQQQQQGQNQGTYEPDVKEEDLPW